MIFWQQFFLNIYFLIFFKIQNLTRCEIFKFKTTDMLWNI